MMPQQTPHYPSPAPAYGQPAYPASHFPNQHQSIPVQVGIPAGPPVFGSGVAQQAVAQVGHVVNGGMGGGHAGNAVIRGSPLSFCGTDRQPNFVQGNLAQDVNPQDNSTASEAPPQSSSFPPGFEPGYNKVVGTGGPQPYQQQHNQYHHQPRPQHESQQQHGPQHLSQQKHYHPQHQRQFQHQPQSQLQPQHQHQHQHQHRQHEHYQNQRPDHSQQHYVLQQPFAVQQQSFHPHRQGQPQGQQPQAQHQHHGQPQGQLQFQPQPQPQPQPQHQHQGQLQGHPQFQPQPPHQHQGHPQGQPQVQPQLQPLPEHHHQGQPQGKLQFQPQPQHQHQGHLQGHPQFQPQLQPQHQHQSHPQRQPQVQPQPQPLPEHQHHPQGQPQFQPQRQHQMQQPQPPLQSQPPFQPQFQLQPQAACQQTQPTQFIPFAKPPSQVYPSNIEACPVNAIAIGVPVIGTAHRDACPMQPPKMGSTQEHSRMLQASQPGNPPTSESSQSSRSNITSGNCLKGGGHERVSASPLPDTDFCSNGWQPSNNERLLQSQTVLSSDPTRPNIVKPPVLVEEKHESSPKPEMQLCSENRKLLINQAESMGIPTSSFGPSHFARSHHCNTHKGPMRSWGNGQRWTNGTSDNQSHFRAHIRDSPSKTRNGFGKAQRNNEETSQWQRPRECKGKFIGKGTGGWSNKQPLRCEPCDRTFPGYEDLNAHLTSHVKCDEEGCTFEAAGKLVKEHKVVKHGKISVQATGRGHRALALRSAEDEEDIKRWREERRNSYPTATNILRKEEERKKRESEGGYFDEEALKRRERIREVIAKQRKLGFQAAEIPSHYFRVPYKNRRPTNGRVDKSMEQVMVKEPSNGMDNKGVRESLVGHKRACRAEDVSVAMESVAPLMEREKEKPMEEAPRKREDKEPVHSACDDMVDNDNLPSKKGNHVRKGARKRILPWQKRQKYDVTDEQWQRPPTLLSKLLQNDIQREKSHLLQCCRFIVNNAFLQEDCSPAFLKHFKWIGVTLASAELGGPSCGNTMNRKGCHSIDDEELPESRGGKLAFR